MEIELIKIRNELRYGSRIYRLRKPKKGAQSFYVCKTVPFCYASINIALDENGIEDMTKVKINNNHKENCKDLPGEYFDVLCFKEKVKNNITNQPLIPLQQIFEMVRSESKEYTNTVMPDYHELSSQSVALIPLRYVDRQFEVLQLDMINNIAPEIGIEKANVFLSYFVRNYFEGEFPVSMWNQFDNFGDYWIYWINFGDPIDPIEPIEQVASNRTQINQSIRSEMASRSMTQSATTQVDGFCPHCGKQFSMRGMTRHKNKCKENFT